MIDYSKIISELGKELSEVRYRYSTEGFEPLYYEREIGEAIKAINKCVDSLKETQNRHIETLHADPYKVEQLCKMLSHETDKAKEHYGARLHHEASGAKVLTIDAGGLRALITHYATHRTDLENREEEM